MRKERKENGHNITFPRFWLENIDMPGVGRGYSSEFMKLKKCATPPPSPTPAPAAPTSSSSRGLLRTTPATHSLEDAVVEIDGSTVAPPDVKEREIKDVEPELHKDILNDYINEYSTMDQIQDGDYKKVRFFNPPEEQVDSVFGIYSSMSSDGKIAAVASEFLIAVYKFNSWCHKWELKGDFITVEDDEKIYQISISGNGCYIVSVVLDGANESTVLVHKYDLLKRD